MSSTQDSLDRLRDLEDVRYRALVDQDWDGFASVCHPDLVYTHATGDTDSLGSYLEKVRAGVFVYHRIDHPIDEIRIVDDVALVIGEMNAEVTAGGTERTLRNRALAVWKRDAAGDWLLLAYQPTPIQERR